MQRACHSYILLQIKSIEDKIVKFSAPLPEHMLKTWHFLDWNVNMVVDYPFTDGGLGYGNIN